jgi:uncharacterized protein (TIGR04255 family)
MEPIKSVKASPAPLPDYDAHPLNEVVFGLAFEPVPMLVPHVGLFWERIKVDFPECRHAPPIATGGGASFAWTDVPSGLPLPRIWFVNEERGELVQLQNDRCYFNWRQKDNNGPYPRFDNLRKKFIDVFGQWRSFVGDTLKTDLTPVECQLTYLNAIHKGHGWTEVGEMSGLFTDFSWQSRGGRFLPAPDLSTWRAVFPLSDGRGSLTAEVTPATLGVDGPQIIRLELSAKGVVIDKDDPFAWFDLAHEWIVRGFADITQLSVQKFCWKRKGV